MTDAQRDSDASQMPGWAPPTAAGPIRLSTRPAWPSTVGTLLIVFGSIGLLQRVVGLVASIVMPNVPFLADLLPPPHLWSWTVALAVVSLPVSVLHLVAGVRTLRRRPSAYALAMGFVVYAVLMLIPGTILQYAMMQWQMQQAAQQNQPMPTMMTSAGYAVFMVLFGAIFALAWPTFVTIWFNIPKHRALVRSWGGA